MTYNFFATISRMKYIERWSLMRNSRPENLSEHSLEVAMIAHALCTIGNVRCGKELDAGKAALLAVYHDASEIITGDLPTPVKYYNDDIKTAYKEVETIALERLLEKLPDDLRPSYEAVLYGPDDESEQYLRGLIKAADKISALIKCIEEENAGNREFRSAKETISKTISQMCEQYPEVDAFMREFIPPYGRTLDELQE